MGRVKMFVWWGALALILFGLVGCGDSFKQGYEQGKQAAQGSQPAETQKQPTWNTKDVNIESNGNIPIAVELLNSSGDIKSKAEDVAPAAVMKAPWKYYGKIVKLTGEVGIAQDYPPGSDVSKSFGGGEVGELVLMNDDSTLIDYLNVGSTGDINVGDAVVVYGYPVGLVEVDNKLGGKTTQLVIVGNAAEKVPK